MYYNLQTKGRCSGGDIIAELHLSIFNMFPCLHAPEIYENFQTLCVIPGRNFASATNVSHLHTLATMLNRLKFNWNLMQMKSFLFCDPRKQNTNIAQH